MFTNIKPCKEEEDYEQFIRFFIQYRNQMTPPYPLTYVLKLLTTHMLKAHIILGFNEAEEVTGAVVYYYGTPLENFIDKENLHIEIVLFRDDIRGTKAFIQGFLYFIDEIENSGMDVENVVFYALSESNYLQRMYSKFAKKTFTLQHDLGDLEVYMVPFKQFSTFARRFSNRNEVGT